MSYKKVSIKKTAGSPGAPAPKNPNIIIIDVLDIETFPARKEGEPTISAPIVLKTGAKAIALYMTPDTIKIGDKTEGDSDAKGFVASLEGYTPGNTPELQAAIEMLANADVVILAQNFGEETYRLLGSPACPMKLTSESQDDKDAVKTKMSFAQAMRSKHGISTYTGEAPEVASTDGL